MTILTMIQAAAPEVGLLSPDTVISNQDNNVKRLLACAQREGKMLVTKKPWMVLQREHTFSTADGTAEYALPSDFSALLSDTAWNRANYDAIRGPLTAQEWQVYKSGNIGGGIVRDRFRIKRTASGNTKTFFIDPTPSAVETVAFEYRSNGWCQSSGGTVQTAWAADTDTGILDEDLMVLGIIWRFKRIGGFDYTTELAEYEQEVSRRFSDDAAPPVQTLHSTRVSRLGGWVPETGYGS